MSGNDIVIENPWKPLKEFTNARIAMGRAGGSIKTEDLLKFRYDHARARDAVHIPLDVNLLKNSLEKLKKVIVVSSMAETRDIYLQRPDLGRKLSEESRQILKKEGINNSYDLAIAVTDGLSSVAIERNAYNFLEKFIPEAQKEGITIAPVTIIEQGRVAAGDEAAMLLNSKIVAILVGERPGLSSPDSMGIYMTYSPKEGTTDERRNCISNIRNEGFHPKAASDKLLYLVKESIIKKISGVELKDLQISDDEGKMVTG